MQESEVAHTCLSGVCLRSVDASGGIQTGSARPRVRATHSTFNAHFLEEASPNFRRLLHHELW
jgi:hypothetical protein